ncbi:SRPBCC family protein [Oleiharenicola sp. Vm1]|uniref:SRPBCC family protein n=1 Tax=Oleiharenicola sp. Vm1 TaxID=3398393 RepID=UPI0039F58CAE
MTAPADAVRLARRFAAPPADVWRAWTDPADVRRWFGSDPLGTVRAARLDVRPGGSFEVAFADRDGTEHTCRGEYLEVVPAARLAFTWRWQSEPGVETRVRVALAADGAGTRMDFEHAHLGAASRHDYARGWQSTFDKLERLLAPPESRAPQAGSITGS